jgi:hypothetical protein
MAASHGRRHAIRTKPGGEALALVGAQAIGLPAFLPVALEPANRRGNYKGGPVVWKPIFVGCVFAALDPRP